MAVKASATVTLSSVVDVKSVTRYYKLQASTLSKPSKPTTNPPSGWTTTEPSYTSGSTNSLYFCDLTVFCDDTFVYSDVSLSSSYEAAKAAYNKAVATAKEVETITTRVTDMDTEFTKTKEEVALKATKTEVTEVSNNLKNNYSTTTQMNSAIDAKADSITSTVSKTYTTKTEASLLSGDPANYSQLNDSTASYWGFTADATADGHWYTMNTLSRDKFVSKYYECSGGEKLSIDFEISTSCKANTVSSGTANIQYVGTAIGIYGYNDQASSVGIAYSHRTTGTADAPATKVSTIVTIPAAARKFRVFVQTEAWNTFSGAIKIRNLRVRRIDAEIATVQTQMTQTSEEIRMDFTKSIQTTSNELQSKIDSTNSSMNTQFTEINKYIRFVDGKIVLGETGNELMLTIQNDRVSFTQSGVEVAYFSNNNLYIKKAEVLTTLRVGNYEFAPRNDGGMALRKRSV